MTRKILLFVAAVAAFTQPANAQDLIDLSFEELLASEVTSVAKRPQKADEAPAAVFVLTKEDIRRTGATTLPELFRYVPGMDVAEIDANNAAVSARGFNWRFSNKLLVLIDGRAIYQSVLSGVLWDEQLTPVEDIDRIEVIRGPGATLYGANAVNGVINIVTKHSADTLGSLAAVQGGVTTSSQQFVGRFVARQGIRLGEHGAARLYVTGRETSGLVDENQNRINNGSQAVQVGFRTDWEPNSRDAFTLQGDYRTMWFDVSLEFPQPVGPTAIQEQLTEEEDEGFNILGRWSRSFTADSKLTVQAFYDWGRRTEFGADFDYTAIDLDISHYFSWGDRFETVWGVGYRSIEDSVTGSGFFTFAEPEFQADLFSGFVQQDAHFLDGRLRISLGSKFEHNDFTGFEIQPSARAIWVDENNWSLWGAVSRAVRTPSRFETSLDFDLGITQADPAAGVFLPVQSALVGDPTLEAEDLLAFEIGWRKTWGPKLSVDLSAYFNDYKNLVIISFAEPNVLTGPFGPGGTFVPFLVEQDLPIQNGREGQVYGLEANVRWDVSDRWKLLIVGDVKDFSFDDIIGDTTGLLQSFQGLSPNYQFTIRSDYQVTDEVLAVVTARRVGELEGSPTPGYTDLDIRLSYRPRPQIEVGILAENLLSASRQEFASQLYPAPFGQVERRVSASIAFRF